MVHHPGEFSVVQCLDCGLAYLNPRPKKEKIAEFYPEEYSPFTEKKSKIFRWIKKMLAQRDIRKLKKMTEKKYDKRNLRILEIGCATGEYLCHLRNDGGCEVTGVELSPFAAECARKEHSLNVVTGTVFDGKFQDKAFDVVIMKHVLEHVYNPSETLHEIHRLLAEDGKFIFVLPNIQCFEIRIFGKYWQGWDVPRHMYHFEPTTIRQVLDKNSFALERISYSSVPNDWIWSSKHYFYAKSYPHFIIQFFDVQNVFLLGLFFPVSLILGALGQSGRIEVVATKRGERK